MLEQIYSADWSAIMIMFKGFALQMLYHVICDSPPHTVDTTFTLCPTGERLWKEVGNVYVACSVTVTGTKLQDGRDGMCNAELALLRW